jgi:hypothetical protein
VSLLIPETPAVEEAVKVPSTVAVMVASVPAVASAATVAVITVVPLVSTVLAEFTVTLL